MHGVDDAERVEEGIDDVDDQKEEDGRREQRKCHCPEPTHRARAVDGRGLEHAFRDRLQPGEEEQEVIGYLFPGCGENDQERGLIAVEQWIPVDAEGTEIVGEHTE